MNIQLAYSVLQRLYLAGVQELALCAGARNAPFIKLLEDKHPFKVHSFFDERSASFFALGACKRSSRPVAVITTSGTAVSETYSAVIEAHYTALPLVIVSADRPKSYRGSCAPQSIVQNEIFGSYAKCYDIDSPQNSEFEIGVKGVTHLNVCFDEPLITAESIEGDWETSVKVSAKPQLDHSEKLAKFLVDKRCPLIVVGGLTPEKGAAVAEKLASIEIPVVAESISNFPRTLSNQLRRAEKLNRDSFDGIIRIGSVPTARFWRDLEQDQRAVINFSDAPFSGLSWLKEVPDSIESFLNTEIDFRCEFSQLLAEDVSYSDKFASLMLRYPEAEISLVGALSRLILAGDDVFVGNSLPIRHWNQVTNVQANHYFNRGVNGIDGLISTAFGCGRKERRLWIVLGDLSALYDLNALASVPEDLQDVTICVINNGGGKIFTPMFGSALFENRHSWEFSSWAKMFGWNYYRSLSEFHSLSGRNILEISPDSESTASFNKEWQIA